jgi:hypothetical protein
MVPGGESGERNFISLPTLPTRHHDHSVGTIEILPLRSSTA